MYWYILHKIYHVKPTCLHTYIYMYMYIAMCSLQMDHGGS